jgi:hypothetical protein
VNCCSRCPFGTMCPSGLQAMPPSSTSRPVLMCVVQPLLEAVDPPLPFIANVSGVGENLGNDGLVFFVFTRDPEASLSPNPNDLYAAGAFLPNPDEEAISGTPRFSQWLNVEPPRPENATSTSRRHLREWARITGRRLHGGEGEVAPAVNLSQWQVGAILLNVSSKGFAHIQSADPLYQPQVTTGLLTDDADIERWKSLMRVS